MPGLLIIAVALAMGFILFAPSAISKAQGYVAGKPVTLDVMSIHDFGCVLRADAAAAWLTMKGAALEIGVVLTPKGERSAFRTEEMQAEMITERPTFAAAQNFSPHQAGVAVDVDLTKDGALDWLHANGEDYGWFPLGSTSAQNKEPWHWEFHPSAIPLVASNVVTGDTSNA